MGYFVGHPCNRIGEDHAQPGSNPTPFSLKTNALPPDRAKGLAYYLVLVEVCQY